MRNPFKKKDPNPESTFVFDGITIKIKNDTTPDSDVEEVDVVEIFDDDGGSIVCETLAKAAYLGENYIVSTIYSEGEAEESDTREVNEVFILKEVFFENQSLLEPVSDEALVNRIFGAFRKAAGDKYDYQDS